MAFEGDSLNGLAIRFYLAAINGTLPAAAAGTTPVKPTPATTATKTSVASAASATSLLAANANRLPGSTIVNESTAILYVMLGAGTVSATNYTYQVDAKSTVPGIGYMPDGWTGAVSGIWASANGFARVTEITA